jgi:hypothetical protein
MDYDSLSAYNLSVDLFCDTVDRHEVEEVVRKDPSLWMLDSGSSHTMTYSRSLFVTFKHCRLPVKTATDEVFYTEGYGDIILHVVDFVGNSIGSVRFSNCWLAPDLAHNLISISQLADMGIKTIFDTDHTVSLLHKASNLIRGHANKRGKHYFMLTSGLSAPEYINSLAASNSLTRAPREEELAVAATSASTKSIPVILAHRRAAHASENKIRASSKHVVGFNIQKGALHGPCEPCLMGKGAALPVSKHNATRDLGWKPGDLIHTDVCGPISVRGHAGSYYFVTFTDQATRFCWVFLLKERSEVLEKFIILRNYLKTQFSIEIKRLHGDNAPEHQPLASYCTSQGIVWDPSPRYRSVLNPIAEIKNRNIIEPTISVMTENQLPRYLWDHIVQAVVFIYNRLLHDSIGKTPYEALYGVQPDVRKWRALGCKCWHLIPKKRRDKLDPHMAEGRFVGYSENLYKIYDIRTKQIVKARDVVFNEQPISSLPAPIVQYDLDGVDGGNPSSSSKEEARYTPPEFVRLRDVLEDSDDTNTTFSAPIEPSHHGNSDDPEWLREYKRTGVLPPIESPNPLVTDPSPQLPSRPQPASEAPSPIAQPAETTASDSLTNGQDTGRKRGRPRKDAATKQAPAPQATRRSSRVRKLSQRMIESLQSHATAFSSDPDLANDYFVNFLNSHPEAMQAFMESAFTGASMIDEPLYKIGKLPKSNEVGYTPTNYADAMACLEAEKWRVSIRKEIQELLRQGTFRVIDREKWMVYKIKHDGTYKSRLVVKGFRQRAGKDYKIHETYAAVAKSMSFKILIALAARFGWIIYSLDVIGAFLNSDLKEAIYIALPDGFEQSGKCGLLLKTLYGLKQSPKEWYTTLHDLLVALGLRRTHADHSVFVGEELCVLIYVDDIFILAPSIDAVKPLVDGIKKQFNCTDNGLLNRFIGMDIVRDSDGIFITQASYIEDCLKRFGLATCKPSPTPFNPKIVLAVNKETASADDIHAYQVRIGTLIWIMIGTRPDIAFAVSVLSRFASNPSKNHFIALQRVFRYLAGTKTLSLYFLRAGKGLIGYCDADWCGPHAESAASTSGFVFLLAGGPVSWSSKKQTAIALSSTESEYIAQAVATQELLWLQLLLTELNVNRIDPTKIMLPKPTVIHADNQGAIALSRNPEFHARTKHVHIKYHFLRKEVQSGNVEFAYINTSEQAADGLTKPLEKAAFDRFIQQLGMRPLPLSGH